MYKTFPFPFKVIFAASKLILQTDCGLWVTVNIIGLYAWFIDLRLQLFIDLLPSRVIIIIVIIITRFKHTLCHSREESQVWESHVSLQEGTTI